MKLHRLLPVTLFGLLVMLGHSGAQTLDRAIASNTVVVVLGPSGIKTSQLAAWTTSHAYSVGTLVRGPGSGLGYICITAGTSTNVAASGPSGQGVVRDGTCTWLSLLARDRTGMTVQNTGTNATATLYCTDSVGASTNLSKAFVLFSGGSGTFTKEDNVPGSTIWGWADKNTRLISWEW